MSTRETHLSNMTIINDIIYLIQRKYCVIVRADAIVEFLRQFEIPEDTIRQF